MPRALNHIKNFIRNISPFHTNTIITHMSLQRDYVLQKNSLSAETKKYFATLLLNATEKSGHMVEEDNGFLITQTNDMKRLKAVTDHCRRAWPKEYIKKTVSKPSKNDTLLSIHIDVHDPRNAIVKDFVLSDEMIATAAGYLKEIPVLYGAYVWYCPNRDAADMVGSQMFHCDREDHKQLKVFIPIDEITADCGPTTCVPANATKNFFERRKKEGLTLSLKNRFADEDVHAHASSKEHAIIGKRGTLAFVDTTNCLHYGSRPAQDGKYHMVLHYLTPFSSKLSNQINPDDLSGSLEDIILSYEDKSPHLREPVN